MAALKPNYTTHLRRSVETERRRLLGGDDSVAPSETSSIIDYEDGNRRPRANSPRRAHTATASSTPRPYKGFPSEAHYLAALQQWADGKKYLEPATGLQGFYGEKTMDDYASRPGLELGLKRKWRARKEKNATKQARA